MRGCFKAALAFGMVAVLAAPALAQGRGGFGGGMGGPVNLLARQEVQKELKLTTEQTEKATALATSNREKMMAELEGVDQADRGAKMMEVSKKLNEEGLKKIKGFLKEEQVTRLTQIDLQQRGLPVLADDKEVAKKLSITDEQATKIKTITADMQAERREIMQSAGDDRQAAGQKVQTLQKETGEKILALLSADQKKTWKEMTGEPFTLPPMQRRPGGNR
jgi:Spy/CpxP family protein refolding chaperone